jgi:hypothetical protein
MREKQRRILKLLALQERRLLAETANCALTEKRLDAASDQMRSLQGRLERDDPTALLFTDLVLERFRRASIERQETQAELESRRKAVLNLKQEIKRIDKVAERLGDKIERDAADKEKRDILERFSKPFDVSAE